jgi:hypothetical protein
MELMDSFQKEALMRSAQQIIDENGENKKGTKVVDIKIHENPENLNVGSKNIIWVCVLTNDESLNDYAITGWRYLKNLHDVMTEHRNERIKELGL